ncbi:hypothetical protein BWQ96_09255 [Gracilariopsis chorda]|uniref:Uncharacterized protein n=1 Tax=Gracilariopsis chorda TaxID=448386 RepID=A0A2V3IG15_9FLOR|nr:hypothetical protein BWQ96_09255 [Gracilariopsis chorda]|eukprot:PXF41029.1 hypothetical protein BWQ96_09255 [Gracilariopsis chorda]
MFQELGRLPDVNEKAPICTTFYDIPKTFESVENIMKVQLDLFRAQTTTTEKKPSMSQKKIILFDEVLENLESFTKEKESNDMDVQRMGQMLLEPINGFQELHVTDSRGGL